MLPSSWKEHRFPYCGTTTGTTAKIQHCSSSALRSIQKHPASPKQEILRGVNSIHRFISISGASSHSHNTCFAGTHPTINTLLPRKNVLFLHCFLDSSANIPHLYKPVLLAITEHLVFQLLPFQPASIGHHHIVASYSVLWGLQRCQKCVNALVKNSHHVFL